MIKISKSIEVYNSDVYKIITLIAEGVEYKIGETILSNIGLVWFTKAL